MARLKLMKADHQSKQYRLEDQLLQNLPGGDREKQGAFIAGLEADMATLAAHPHPEDGFAGMGSPWADTLTDKENAGAALAGRLQGGQRGRPGAGGQLPGLHYVGVV